MRESTPLRRIILTHWNAGVFKKDMLERLLPELVVYALLYNEVYVREEDLITNRHITRMLHHPQSMRILEEMLAVGLVKLLRLPPESYPTDRRLNPWQSPISARAEEHEIRRSYKGKPWKATRAEWSLFKRLDGIIVKHDEASRFHAPFPKENTFATELAELLEHRERYSFSSHRVFKRIPPKTADAFIRFCREPEAWMRFVRDNGGTPIVSMDQGFYRSAAYQCLNLLPVPRSMQRLVESVYAATYCDREESDGRYGGSNLIELPFRYGTEEERGAANEMLTQIEVVPTTVSATIRLEPGIADIVLRTRDSPAFKKLQETLFHLGTDNSDLWLPTESVFTGAWRRVCRIFAEQTFHKVRHPTSLETRWSICLYVIARVVGCAVLPVNLDHPGTEVLHELRRVSTVKTFAPPVIAGLRAMLRAENAAESLLNSVSLRCSRVPLNKAKGPNEAG